MSIDAILAVGLVLFGLNLVGVYIFLRLKFNKWRELDR